MELYWDGFTVNPSASVDADDEIGSQNRNESKGLRQV